MTFEVTIDDSNDLLVKNYLEQVREKISEVAKESTVEMIVDMYHFSLKAMEAMEEYRKNPDDVCSHAELMQRYDLT